MSNQKNGFVSPAWPKNENREHAITEIYAPFAGASSPYGDDLVLPMLKRRSSTTCIHTPHQPLNKALAACLTRLKRKDSCHLE